MYAPSSSSNLNLQRLGLAPSLPSAISDYAAELPQWLLPRTLRRVPSPAELPTLALIISKLHRLFGAKKARLALQMTPGIHRLSRHTPLRTVPSRSRYIV